MERLLLVDATCKFHVIIFILFHWILFYFEVLTRNVYFRVEELRDSTAHAEMICIRAASNVLRTWRVAVIKTVLILLNFICLVLIIFVSCYSSLGLQLLAL